MPISSVPVGLCDDQSLQVRHTCDTFSLPICEILEISMEILTFYRGDFLSVQCRVIFFYILCISL